MKDKSTLTESESAKFEALQRETGGRLILLDATPRGLHVAYWSHDPNGNLIIGENWWEPVE